MASVGQHEKRIFFTFLLHKVTFRPKKWENILGYKGQSWWGLPLILEETSSIAREVIYHRMKIEIA
jgi:hypothetical protein